MINITSSYHLVLVTSGHWSVMEMPLLCDLSLNSVFSFNNILRPVHFWTYLITRCVTINWDHSESITKLISVLLKLIFGLFSVNIMKYIRNVTQILYTFFYVLKSKHISLAAIVVKCSKFCCSLSYSWCWQDCKQWINPE